jgi:hypothetical protein
MLKLPCAIMKATCATAMPPSTSPIATTIATLAPLSRRL